MKEKCLKVEVVQELSEEASAMSLFREDKWFLSKVRSILQRTQILVWKQYKSWRRGYMWERVEKGL